MQRWMDDLRIYVLFNSISVISGQWADDNIRLCAMELREILEQKFMKVFEKYKGIKRLKLEGMHRQNKKRVWILTNKCGL